MNTWQACRRIQSVLTSMRWGGSGDNVFPPGAVRVTKAAVEPLTTFTRFPAALIVPGSGQSDEQEPSLMTREISIVIFVSSPGDMVGENPLMGANRLNATSSDGRGLLEIETELFAEIAHLNAAGQFKISYSFDSGGDAQYSDDTGYHAWGDYTFRAWLTAAKEHQEPRNVTATDSSGTVTIAWEAPDDVTNLTGYIVRRAAGTTPVAYPTEGTDVPWTSGLSCTDSPGSGTFTYSVFAAYDDEGGSVEHDFSDYTAAEVTV